MADQFYEGVVRPFQLPDDRSTQPYLPPGQTSRSPISIVAGKTIASKGLRMFNYTYHAEYTFYLDQQIIEQTTEDDSNNGPSEFFDQ